MLNCRAMPTNAIKAANAAGFAVNVSADTLAEVDAAKAAGFANVEIALPESTQENFKTAAGHTVVICPAITHEDVSCKTCKLCAMAERKAVVGFPAHGTARKLVRLEAK